MAITFDPVSKIIQLDRFNVSERELWTAYVDWSLLSDNLKYGVGMTQLGGFVPIALYTFLELGWTIRPQEADGITKITGNLLVQGGGNPIAPTLGNFNILVNMETPVKAVALEVSTGSGSSSGGATAAQVYSEFTAGNNADVFKADVSNVAKTTDTLTTAEIAEGVWRYTR